MSAERRTVLAGLLARLESLPLSPAELTELRPLLGRELARYSERSRGRPSGPSARVRGRVREVQLLRDMRETLEAMLAEPGRADAERAALEQMRDHYPPTAAAAFESIGRKHRKPAEAIGKAFQRHDDAVRLAHSKIKLGADTPKRPRRAPRRT